MKLRRLAVHVTPTLLLCGLFFAQENSYGQTRAYVEFEPLATIAVTPGHTTPVQFTFHVKEGYHINSNKPTTNELIPTTLGFTPPPDLVIAKVQYPPGQMTSFPFDPTEKLSVYSGDLTIRAVIIPQRHAPSGTYTVHGEFKYQACDNNACYPPKKLPFTFNVKVGTRSAGVKKARPTATSPHIHN